MEGKSGGEGRERGGEGKRREKEGKGKGGKGPAPQYFGLELPLQATSRSGSRVSELSSELG